MVFVPSDLSLPPAGVGAPTFIQTERERERTMETWRLGLRASQRTAAAKGLELRRGEAKRTDHLAE